MLKTILTTDSYIGTPPISRLFYNHLSSSKTLSLRYPPQVKTPSSASERIYHSSSCCSRNVIVCGLKGPRPRYPRVWKTQKRIGTISKSKKLVDCVKGLSNVKEEVYGALDAFIAWDLEFPLITVKKALKTLEVEKEWKRVIQVTKWMLSKGQGRTMGSYFTLLSALAEEDRLEEAEELWTKLFSEHLESMPRMFFDKMIGIYYSREMHDKMFDTFADMEELGIRPTTTIVSKVGDVFRKLGMMDKYEKLNRKYPPSNSEYKYIKGKRVKVRAKQPHRYEGLNEFNGGAIESNDADEVTNSSDEDHEYDKQLMGLLEDNRPSFVLDDEAREGTL